MDLQRRLGTCSWAFPSWEGLVYEDGTMPGPVLLAEYATRFGCVEVDRWFWSLFPGGVIRLPEARDVMAYRDAVPPGFRFAVKVANSITLTHEYSRPRGGALVPNPHFLSPSLTREFLDRLEPIREILGPVMFQFEYLNRRKMGASVAFLDALGSFAARLPDGYGFAVEVRNPEYLADPFFDLLADLHWTPVLISGYWMPSLINVWTTYRERLAAFDPVIRLMGPDRTGIEERTGKTWDRIVDPHDEELDHLVTMLRSLSDLGRGPFVFVNNHYEGSAPLTIGRLLDRLAQDRDNDVETLD